MKVADYIINYLADKGIDTIFEVYGSANGDLIDAFTRTDKTRYVAMMHEQAAGFAAEGYAKTSGKVGVAIATSGPGGQNLLTPMANCFYDSVPVLFITGQVKTPQLRPNESIRQVGFQECNIVSMAKPVTKYAALILKPEYVSQELHRAFFLCQQGRKGSVLLDIPIDIQKAEFQYPETYASFDDGDRSYCNIQRPKAHKLMEAYLTDLKKAKSPVLLIGGGCWGSKDVFRELGRNLQIPCFPTWNALDIVTSDYEYYAGRVGTYGGDGRNLAIQKSDLLLAIGTRVSCRITGANAKSFAPLAKKYMVNVDIMNTGSLASFDVGVPSDSRLFMVNLLNSLQGVPDFSDWTKQAMEWKWKYRAGCPEFASDYQYVNPYAFMRVLSEKADAQAVIVADCGGNIVIASQVFDTKYGQRFITSNGNSPMGFAMAGAIGAWFAAPQRQIICIIGDGGFNMNIQELRTIKNYGIKIKVFIINNHIYGITKQFQETNFEGRAEACGPKGYNPPNFIRIAQAYDIATNRINTNMDIPDKIEEVLDAKESVICDVNCHEWHTYEPRVVGWDTPIDQMTPEVYEGNH